MKKNLFIGLFVLSSLFVFAGGDSESINNQKLSVVSGVVVDPIDGEPLVGVKVYVPGTEKSVYTDFDGKFSLVNLKPGEEVKFSMVSYKDVSINNTSSLEQRSQLKVLLKSN